MATQMKNKGYNYPTGNPIKSRNNDLDTIASLGVKLRAALASIEQLTVRLQEAEDRITAVEKEHA